MADIVANVVRELKKKIGDVQSHIDRIWLRRKQTTTTTMTTIAAVNENKSTHFRKHQHQFRN